MRRPGQCEQRQHRFAAQLLVVTAASIGMAASAWAGPWTTPPGTARVGVMASHWQADERFVGVPNDIGHAPGERAPSLSSDVEGANLTYQQLALNLAVGVLEGVELTAFVPYVRADYEDANELLQTDGLGDVLVGANWRVLDPVAFGVELKIPVAEVETAARLPVSEGQFDLAFWQRTGAAFGWHGWASLDLGYRVRFSRDLDDSERAVKPGNEFVARGGGGWRPGASWDWNWLAVTLVVDGLFGQDGEDIAFPDDDEKIDILPLKRRELVELQTGLLFGPWNELSVSATYAHPVYGLNYPAGPRVLLSVDYAFAFFPAE